jgi:hypothetical protein
LKASGEHCVLEYFKTFHSIFTATTDRFIWLVAEAEEEEERGRGRGGEGRGGRGGRGGEGEDLREEGESSHGRAVVYWMQV